MEGCPPVPRRVLPGGAQIFRGYLPTKPLYLEEDIGAGAMEAVWPGVKCGDEGTAFQGAGPGAWLLHTCPVAHGALAVSGHEVTQCRWDAQSLCPPPPVPSAHQVRQVAAVTSPGP